MRKIYGYCRVSTPKQHIDRQVKNIRSRYPDAEIYRDEWTGRTMERKGWRSLMQKVESDSHCTIVFDEVSRMSRDAKEGFETYEKLMDMGVELIFLKEPYINTEVYKDALKGSIENTGNEIADIYIDATNKLLKLLAKRQIEAAFESSQHEIDYLRQRTTEGISAARQRGKQIGRKPGKTLITKKEKKCIPEIKRLSKDFDGANKDTEIIKILGIDKNTYYKYKRKIINEVTT